MSKDSDTASIAAAAPGGGALLNDAELKVWQTFVDGGSALMSQLSTSFAAAGLSVPEMRLLEVAAQRDSAGISELAAAMHTGVSTVSRMVGRLVQVGALERVSSRSDARHRLVRLSDSGRQMLLRQRLVRDFVIRKYVINTLTAEEFVLLGHMFGKVRGACDRS